MILTLHKAQRYAGLSQRVLWGYVSPKATAKPLGGTGQLHQRLQDYPRRR